MIRSAPRRGGRRRVALAARLTRLAGMHAGFFCNSGAEADEAALEPLV